MVHPLTIVNVVFFIANLSFFAFANGKRILEAAGLAATAASIAGWRYTIFIAAVVVRLKLQQWWGKNIQNIEDGRYVISNVINNQEVKTIVKYVPKKEQPVKVFTEDRRDITEYAGAFFRVIPEEVSPDFFFENNLIIADGEGNEDVMV